MKIEKYAKLKCMNKEKLIKKYLNNSIDYNSFLEFEDINFYLKLHNDELIEIIYKKYEID